MGFLRKLFGQKPTKETQKPIIYRTCLKCHHSNPHYATTCELCEAKIEALDKESIERMQLKLRVEELIKSLRVQDRKMRERTVEALRVKSMVEALREIGSPAIQPLITAVLYDSDRYVQRQAKIILDEISDVRAVDPLIATLRDADSKVRTQAAIALGKIADARAVDPLITALKDSDSHVRAQAAIALGKIVDARAVDPLANALKDSNSSVQAQAAIALGEIADARAVNPLTTALKDSDNHVRTQAAIALGKIADARAVDPLIAALKDSDSRGRAQAAIALGKIADARAVDPLITALKDSDSHVRAQAAKALDHLDRYWDEWQRVEIAMTTKKPELAINLAGVEIDPLIVALDDSDWSVTAAIALGQIGNVRAVEPLITALNGSVSKDVRAQAAIALGKIRDARAVEPLITALKDSNSYVRRQAAITLGKIGDARAIMPLVAIIEGSDKRVLKSVIEALSKLGHEVLPPKWPAFSSELYGNIAIRVNNPNNFHVRVGIRSGDFGKDFMVHPKQIGAVKVPPGSYRVYFQYSTDPLALFQGNDIQLTFRSVQIDMQRSHGGNYGIRRV